MPRQITAMATAEWRTFLDQERTAVLASGGPGGFPHLVAMWYVPREDGLLMWTYAKSQKARNLRRDPRVSVLVEAGEQYDELRGVLIQAEAELIEDFEQVYDAGRALHARYAANRYEAGPDADAGVRAQASKRVLIRVPYARVRSWDHRKLRGG